MTPALRRGAFLRVWRVLAPWPVLADRVIVDLDDLGPEILGWAEYVPAGAERIGPRTWYYPRGKRKKPLPPLVARVTFGSRSWSKLSDRARRELAVHEAAHLLADHFNGSGIGCSIRPHGPEWREWTKRLCGRELRPRIEHPRRERPCDSEP